MNTEIIFITDRSGSMVPLRHDVVGGFNSFLDDQRKVGGAARVTLVLFNNERETVCQARPLEGMPPLSDEMYCPGGGTALLDAIGFTLEQEGKRIAAEGWAEKVIVNINTDGEENASITYNAAMIKEMISHAQDKAGWVFVFQAANQDAFVVGQLYGISAATIGSFVASGAGVARSYGTLSAMTTSVRTAAMVQAAGALVDAIASMPLPQSPAGGVLPDAVASLPTP